jgi:sugar phosphate isomerase/epimerase
MTGVGLDEITGLTEAEQDRLGVYLEEHDLLLNPSAGFNYIEATPEDIARNTEKIAAGLQKAAPLLRSLIVTTGPWGLGHRFDRSLPLEEKLERLSRAIAPLAAICKELGTPLGIENHGDVYCSDLVEVCERAPGLGIFLDTGNTYLIGERPLPAFEAAAPYTVGTHFKDHRVRPCPEARPLHFEVAGSALGQGDVPLRECFELLMQKTPNPERLAMEIEMVCPEGMGPVECFNESLAFVTSL